MHQRDDQVFVGDFDAAFWPWIELRMKHVHDAVGDARLQIVQTVVLERAQILAEAFIELRYDEVVKRNACI